MSNKLAIIGLSTKGVPVDANPSEGVLDSYVSWAIKAHYPALYQLKDLYDLKGVLGSSKESSESTAKTLKKDYDLVPYGKLDELYEDENIDTVVVSVRVPYHYENIEPYFKHAAKKNLLVEWPLGRNLKEAESVLSQIDDLSKTGIFLQGRKSLELLKVKELINDGKIGKVLSSSFKGYTGYWGNKFLDGTPQYLYTFADGANLLTVPFGHGLDSFLYVLGAYPKELYPQVLKRFPEQEVIKADGTPVEPARTVSVDTPDQILVSGSLQNDIVVSFDLRGGLSAKPKDDLLYWEIHGTDGDIIITSKSVGYAEISPLEVDLYTKDGKSEHFDAHEPIVGNIKRVYEGFAKSKNDAQKFEVEGYPTFKDALNLHTIIDKIVKGSEEKKVIVFSEDEFN